MPKGEHFDTEHQTKAGSASRTHGIYSMRDAGPDALLDPTKITRMSELRQLLRTQPGRDDVLLEVIARLTMMVEFGFASIAERYEGDHVTPAQRLKIWKDPVVKHLPRYVDMLTKGLVRLPTLDDSHDAELERIRNAIVVEDDTD